MSGELERVGGRAREEIEQRAGEVDKQIVKIATVARGALTRLAPLLLEMYENRYWEVLDYDSMNQYLASPYIELSPSYAKALAYTYRDLVVVRDVPPKELDGIDVRKLQIGLWKVKEGRENWQDLIDDARRLSRSDMERSWGGKRSPRAALDATEEPERVPCPMCGSYVEAGRIPGEEREAA